jgi:membrane protease YdiL (CAAX protease family)
MTKAKAFARVILVSVLFLVAGNLVRRAVIALWVAAHRQPQADLHVRVTLGLTAAAVVELLMLLLLAWYLRSSGRGLGALGVARRAPGRAWVATVVITILLVLLYLSGPLRGHVLWNDWSAFRIYNALVAGVVAGFVEEVVFRGYIMTELAEARTAPAVQVLLSGLLFGLAHTGWGLFSGHVNWGMLVGAVGGTMILGWIYAGLYLFSRRSLWPVIVSHGVLDLIIEPWLFLAALSGLMGPAR